jgi:D-glycero-alpha-D-manno-heptose-7-phosphate kinase
MAGDELMPAEFRAAAPVRLDLAGGWTDVPPFSAEQGGVVVNAAIGLRVHAIVRTGGGSGIAVASRDIGERSTAASAAELPIAGPLALLAAAVRRFPPPGSAELSTRSEVPPGSGLGSSGALDVAMVAALLSARGEACGRMELAHRAWQVESVDVGIPGGKQDQYAAALGGFNRLRFGADEVAREPLALDDGVRDALARATLLCYTGKSRLSGNTIARVIAAYERRESAVTGALFGIRETAERMAEALPSGDLARIGALLEANWKHQQSLDAAMRTAEMAELERAVRSAGGLGGKAAGAGAGGCMFFIVEDFPRAAAAARSVGSEVLPVTWDFEGVTAC